MSINKGLKNGLSQIILSDIKSGVNPQCCLRSFIEHQILDWNRLRTAREIFNSTITRKVLLNHLDITLQHNQQRIKSSSSSVDRKSIEKRPCFLCPENLYSDQKALLYKQNWLILCNPFPIFNDHLVVSHTDHLPQSIFPAIDAMTSFVKDFGFAFSVFFNGPAAGASAPDHLHFQVCPADSIPVEWQVPDLIKNGSRLLKKVKGSFSEFFTELDNRTMFTCSSEEPDFINRFIKKTCLCLQNLNTAERDPSVNIIVSGHNNILTAIVFPRKTHRPACYYETGDRRIMVSPGAVDVGGLIIMPRERDFLTVDKKMLLDIFSQVCLDRKSLNIKV